MSQASIARDCAPTDALGRRHAKHGLAAAQGAAAIVAATGLFLRTAGCAGCIIVTPRSYLDGGTEVLPGQRKFNFSDAQPYWSPIDALGPGRNYDRQPLNPRWEQGWTRMEY